MYLHPIRRGVATSAAFWGQGMALPAVVLDLGARRIVGWALSRKPDADLVIKVLDMAYEQRGRPQGQLDSVPSIQRLACSSASRRKT